ncbi:MAG: FtsX-like permease family protein [Bacteroidetes bacterium]|nr:MAG: FtsX-like permease family protein [Bacteroidota bacterium]
MTKSILLVFLRKLKQGDFYSIINLLGLSIGIAACLMIFLYISDELKYDRHHHDPESIYRLLQYNSNQESKITILPGAMHDYLEDRVTGVESMGRFQLLAMELVFQGDREPLTETSFAIADPAFLEIFSFVFIRGEPSTALSSPNSIILTRSAAEKYFGSEDSMGKTLLFENSYPFIVSGIIEDLPEQSHFHFSMLGSVQSMTTINPTNLTDWNNIAFFYYFRLHPESDTSLAEEQITQIVWNVRERYKDIIFYQFQPLLDVRLRSADIDWDAANTGSITVVHIFSFIALLILALACFNFINLSVAMSMKRAREIGIKKTMGASRVRLITQFLSETFIIGFIALLISFLLIETTLPFLNIISGKSLSIGIFASPQIWIFSISILLIITLIAGGYPALVISGFKPITALRGVEQAGGLKVGGGHGIQFRLRQILLLLQFAVSTSLIVVSLMIYLQMNYISGRHPGYEKENLIAIKNPLDERMDTRAVWIKDQLKQNANVLEVSLSHNLPPVPPHIFSNFSFERTDGRQQINGALISCDADFFTTLRSEIVSGRNFSPEMITDQSETAIINQTMWERMGVDDPIGINLGGFFDGQQRRIIGVVENISYTSAHEPVGPMVFYIDDKRYPHNFFNILVRYQEGASASVLHTLENLWLQEAPEWPLQYQFVELKAREYYQDDRRTMLIIMSFSGLAILLSILGLMGLALYSVTTRTREIGIRKVLGATIGNITRMMNREFAILLIISNLIAWPAAWYFTQRWLENFAYRIQIQWLAFITPAILVFLIAILVVSVITIRAALKNPVYTIKATE